MHKAYKTVGCNAVCNNKLYKLAHYNKQLWSAYHRLGNNTMQIQNFPTGRHMLSTIHCSSVQALWCNVSATIKLWLHKVSSLKATVLYCITLNYIRIISYAIFFFFFFGERIWPIFFTSHHSTGKIEWQMGRVPHLVNCKLHHFQKVYNFTY